MTRIPYSKIEARLIQLEAEIDAPSPRCPKDAMCRLIKGECALRDKTSCIQWCSFFLNGGRFFIPVTFAIQQNGQEGFVVKESPCIKNLLNKGILRDKDLE